MLFQHIVHEIRAGYNTSWIFRMSQGYLLRNAPDSHAYPFESRISFATLIGEHGTSPLPGGGLCDFKQEITRRLLRTKLLNLGSKIHCKSIWKIY